MKSRFGCIEHFHCFLSYRVYITYVFSGVLQERIGISKIPKKWMVLIKWLKSQNRIDHFYQAIFFNHSPIMGFQFSLSRTVKYLGLTIQDPKPSWVARSNNAAIVPYTCKRTVFKIKVLRLGITYSLHGSLVVPNLALWCTNLMDGVQTTIPLPTNR